VQQPRVQQPLAQQPRVQQPLAQQPRMRMSLGNKQNRNPIINNSINKNNKNVSPTIITKKMVSESCAYGCPWP
jgi:hypothetical protein